jgi:hypothetical protein
MPGGGIRWCRGLICVGLGGDGRPLRSDHDVEKDGGGDVDKDGKDFDKYLSPH